METQQNSKTNKRKNFFSEWLEQLQQESWQLELLISGLLLYGILNAGPYLVEFDKYVSVNVANEGASQYFARPIYYFAEVAWGIFLINFLTHIVLRGFWIGAIGLRYISGEIEYDELNYSKRFTEHLEKRVGSFDDYIEKLERACSVIFAFSFLLLFIFLSFLCFGFHIFFLGNFVDWVSDHSDALEIFAGLFIIAYIIIAFLVFIDFITLGLFKKIKDPIVSRIYFYIYVYFSYTTLSFFYRPLLYNFLDDKYTKRLLLLSVPYYFLLLTIPFMRSNSNPFFPYDYKRNMNYKEEQYIDKNSIHYFHYMDQLEEIESSFTVLSDHIKIIEEAAINTYIQQEPYLELFIRQNEDDIQYLKKWNKIKPLYKTGLLHPVFSSLEKDSSYIQIVEEQKAEFQHIRGNKNAYTSEEYKAKRDSVTSINRQERNEYKVERLSKLKNAFQNSMYIMIDEKSVDSLAICKYYEYPNAREKGMLCHIPIHNLSDGEHILHIKKRISTSSSRRYNKHVYIPFIKVNSK